MSAAGWGPSASMATLARRAALLACARAFFARSGVMEVETPALVAVPVSDPQLANLSVLGGDGFRRGYLHTSPEYHMKRLLAAGAPDIYQLCKVWRDGEDGPRHLVEFTLLEWYRRGYGLGDMADETVELLGALAAAAGSPPPAISRTTYRDLLQATAGIDPLADSVATIRERTCRLLSGKLAPGLAAALGDDRQAWLDLLVSHAVADRLAGEGLVVVTHYPADQAMLARLAPEDPRVAERFEVFWNGLEIANGYRELTDPAEQAARMAADRRRRQALGRPDVPPDTALLAALEAGLPDCAGVAVGFDRALMAALRGPALTCVVSFSPGADAT